jgi:hypothetical protein
MKTKTLILTFFVTFLSVSGIFAQDGDPCPPNQPDCDVAPDGPIDKNIGFLAAGAFVLGIAVIYKNKIKKASV